MLMLLAETVYSHPTNKTKHKRNQISIIFPFLTDCLSAFQEEHTDGCDPPIGWSCEGLFVPTV